MKLLRTGVFLLATLLAFGNWTVDRENKTLCAYGPPWKAG
jgi:hypothetical protein